MPLCVILSVFILFFPLWQEYIVYNVFQNVTLIELDRVRTPRYLVDSPLMSVELTYQVSAVSFDGVEGKISSSVQTIRRS